MSKNTHHSLLLVPTWTFVFIFKKIQFNNQSLAKDLFSVNNNLDNLNFEKSLNCTFYFDLVYFCALLPLTSACLLRFWTKQSYSEKLIKSFDALLITHVPIKVLTNFDFIFCTILTWRRKLYSKLFSFVIMWNIRCY